jgi:hypothetical protein
MSGDLTPADLIDKAADHILMYGWLQGDYYLTASATPAECPVCPRGGIAVGAGRHPEFVADWPLYCAEYKDDEDSWAAFSADRESLRIISEAEEAFAAHLDRRGLLAEAPGDFNPHELIEWWNDRRERTAEQVVTELRACAADLRQGAG